MKSKLEIYALTVCFAAVVCLVVSAGIAGYAAFRIATPELTLSSYNYDKFQTNEAFWKSRGDSCSDEKTTEVRPGEEVLTKQRLEAFSLELKGEERAGNRSSGVSYSFWFRALHCLFIGKLHSRHGCREHDSALKNRPSALYYWADGSVI